MYWSCINEKEILSKKNITSCQTDLPDCHYLIYSILKKKRYQNKFPIDNIKAMNKGNKGNFQNILEHNEIGFDNNISPWYSRSTKAEVITTGKPKVTPK